MENFEYRTNADINALIKAQEVAEKYKAKNIKLGKSIRDTKRKAWFFPNTHEGARQDVAIYTQDKEVKEPSKSTKNYKMYEMLNSGKTLREIGDYFDIKQGNIKSTLIKYCNKWGLKIDLPEEKTI